MLRRPWPKPTTRHTAGRTTFRRFVLPLALCAGTAQGAQLDWNAINWPPGALAGNYAIGNGTVSFSIAGDTPYLDNGSPDDVNSYLTGGYAGQQALYVATDYPDPPAVVPNGRTITVTIAFSHRNGVRGVSFQTWDLDRDAGNFTDQMTVTASDGATTFNPTAVTNDSAYNAFDGTNTITGTAPAGDATAEGTVIWRFDQAHITSITIVYRNVEPANANIQHTAIHDIDFTAEADLTASTKSVVDLNGGNLVPGDVLRYTVAVTNSGEVGLDDVSLWDDLPASIDSYGIVALPAGAVDGSTGPGTGANGTGRIEAAGFDVAGQTSATAVFDVTISATAPDGTAFDNTAEIFSADDAVAPSAPRLIVNAPVAVGRVKELYLDNAAGNALSRTRPAGSTATTIAKGGAATFRLKPRTEATMTLAAGTLSIPLRLAKQGVVAGNRDMQVVLDTIGATAVTLGSQAISGIAFGPVGAYQTVTFNIVLAAPVTLNANTEIRLRIANNSTGAGARGVTVRPVEGGIYSAVNLNSLTVIHVDSVATYTAPYPATTLGTVFPTTATAYVRATISDPFGSYDIAPAGGAAPEITIQDATGAVAVAAAPMSLVATAAASKTFEYAYSLPANAAPGDWTHVVTAHEGVEGVVRDARAGSFRALGAVLSIVKSSAVVSDPINGSDNPKRVPGAVVRYTITISNGTNANAIATAIVITDVLPAAVLYVAGSMRRSADAACNDADATLTDSYDVTDDGSISAGTVIFGDSNGGADLALSPSGTQSYCFYGVIK